MKHKNLNYAICIPARMGSTRFPEKPIALLNGKPMVKRVYDRCKESGFSVYVLTDSKRVHSLFPEGDCFYMEKYYDNGTERCSAFPMLDSYDGIINVQGDMPDITVEIIKSIANGLALSEDVVTVYTKMNKDLQKDPNSVKLIHTDNKAHWFCRSSLEYGSHHLGVYGYTKEALTNYKNLMQYTEEQIEKLEQLRWLQNGYSMSVFEVDFNGMEINTPEELEEWHRRNSQ